MSQPSSITDAQHRLLRRVFGIRLHADGLLEIPLRHTWKAFSRAEFFALWIVVPYGVIMSDTASRAAVHFGTFLLVAFALYLGLAAVLVVRRGFSTRLHSGVGALAQRRQTYTLPITGTVLGSTKRKRQPFVLLDGVQFPLATRVFTSKEERLRAVQVLREWTATRQEACLATPNSKTALLALLDVTSVEGSTVRFRAVWSNFATFVFLVCGFPLTLLPLLPVLAVSSADFSFAFDVMLALMLLCSLGLAICLQQLKPTVAVTANKGVEIVEHGEQFTCPPWQSEFVMGRPNPYDDSGPVYPYIQLKYGNRYLTIHSSRMYEEDELEDFVDRMNHFLWAGPTQPADPATRSTLVRQ